MLCCCARAAAFSNCAWAARARESSYMLMSSAVRVMAVGLRRSIFV